MALRALQRTSRSPKFFLIKVTSISQRRAVPADLIIISRVTNPAKCQCLLRHQHPARPQLRPEAPRGHHQGPGEGGGAVQRLQLHPGKEERHQQGKEKAAWTGPVIISWSPSCLSLLNCSVLESRSVSIYYSRY